MMIVDLLRNDLSKVCSPGSIRVPSLCAVETYETVQHLVSVVRGTLGRDSAGQQLNAWDLLAALFPGGSITGAPKVRAMEIIAELEPTARTVLRQLVLRRLRRLDRQQYPDSDLYRSPRLDSMLCRRWIVAQSDPAAEYEETLHKAAGMLQALTPNPEPRTSAP